MKFTTADFATTNPAEQGNKKLSKIPRSLRRSDRSVLLPRINVARAKQLPSDAVVSPVYHQINAGPSEAFPEFIDLEEQENDIVTSPYCKCSVHCGHMVCRVVVHGRTSKSPRLPPVKCTCSADQVESEHIVSVQKRNMFELALFDERFAETLLIVHQTTQNFDAQKEITIYRTDCLSILDDLETYYRPSSMILEISEATILDLGEQLAHTLHTKHQPNHGRQAVHIANRRLFQHLRQYFERSMASNCPLFSSHPLAQYRTITSDTLMAEMEVYMLIAIKEYIKGVLGWEVDRFHPPYMVKEQCLILNTEAEVWYTWLRIMMDLVSMLNWKTLRGTSS
jgi:hypothetical protein